MAGAGAGGQQLGIRLLAGGTRPPPLDRHVASPPPVVLHLPRRQVVTTLTTVGFGDVVATSFLGKAVVIATICIGARGVLLVRAGAALPWLGPQRLASPAVTSRGWSASVRCMPVPRAVGPSADTLGQPWFASHLQAWWLSPCKQRSCTPSSRRAGWCGVSAGAAAASASTACCCCCCERSVLLLLRREQLSLAAGQAGWRATAPTALTPSQHVAATAAPRRVHA